MLKRPSRAMNPHSNPDGGGGDDPPQHSQKLATMGSLVSDFHITHILYGWMIILPDIEIQIETSNYSPCGHSGILHAHWSFSLILLSNGLFMMQVMATMP